MHLWARGIRVSFINGCTDTPVLTVCGPKYLSGHTVKSGVY